jgi:hypothetical protein
MAEDSGAFKTNPRNSARFRRFVMTRQRVASKPHRIKKTFPGLPRAFTSPICNKRHRYLAVFSNQPDSLRAGGVRCVANAVNSVVAAFPIAQGPSQLSCEGGTRLSMLPGFRFLFAAIVLSMSVLVFGLGAAALLRAAHEEFASNSSWRAAPETTFAQQSEATPPVLAMLRLDPLPAEQKAPDDVPAVAAPAEPAVAVPAAAEPEKIAALKAEDSLLPEPAKPEIPVSETLPQTEAAPAQADAPASPSADETKVAASEQASSPTNEAAPAASGQMSAAVLPEADIVSTKIATLGGPTVTIEAKPPAKAAGAKPDGSVIKKRLQAQRRRMAARARVARQAAQQPADPFAQPSAPPAAAAARSR